MILTTGERAGTVTEAWSIDTPMLSTTPDGISAV
jgi:hypothetical protein